MKKRLLALTLALLFALLLISPVVALSPQTSQAHAEHIASVKFNNQMIRASRLQSICQHPNAISFVKLETDESGMLCTDCAQIIYDSTITATTAVLKTSAELQRLCTHSFGDWIYSSSNQHARSCSLCALIDYDTHEIVPPTCATNAYCSLCGGHSDDWPDSIAWGHVWELRFDSERWVDSNETEYYHGEYCIRTNDYGDPICTAQRYYTACTMQTRWDPAEDGMHWVYDQCDYCYMVGDMIQEECDALAPGYACYRCDNDPWA